MFSNSKKYILQKDWGFRWFATSWEKHIMKYHCFYVCLGWWITYNLESTRCSRGMMWWVWWYDNYVAHKLTNAFDTCWLSRGPYIHIHNYMQVDGPESWEIARHISPFIVEERTQYTNYITASNQLLLLSHG